MANTPNNDLKQNLTRYRQIRISVIGRKSGKTISIPVWFVLEGRKALSAARTGLRHAVIKRTCSRIR
jgi:hypothetical protein